MEDPNAEPGRPEAERIGFTSVRTVQPLGRSDTVVFVLSGSIDPHDIQALCDHICEQLAASDADRFALDVGSLEPPDAVTVDALARMRLTSRRLGRRVGVRNACEELVGLLDLVGLSDLAALCADLPLEPEGEAEQGEETLGVQEERDPRDPVP